jgi:hypothetical protein
MCLCDKNHNQKLSTFEEKYIDINFCHIKYVLID